MPERIIPMTKWYVQHCKKTLGPFNDEALRELVTSGKINKETLAKNGEEGSWIRCGKLKGLFADEIPIDSIANALNKIDINTAKVNKSIPQPVPQRPPTLAIQESQIGSKKPSVKFSDISAHSTSKIEAGSIRKTRGFVLLLASVISLTVGYVAGAEHAKYSIRAKLSQIGAAFKQSVEKKSEAVKDIDLLTKPKARVKKASDLDASRREWISVSYGSVIAYKDELHWTDSDIATGKLLFTMNYLDHTSEYVELLNPSRSDQIRLFPDRMEAKHEKGWETIGSGHWKK